MGIRMSNLEMLFWIVLTMLATLLGQIKIQ